MKITTLLSILFFSLFVNAQNLRVYDLTCEHLTNPVGIEEEKPRFSWKIKTDNKNVLQTAYSLRVADNPSFKKGVIWESGKINSSESNLIAYAGPALESAKRYYWQVRVWDNQGNKSEWSETAYWEMGLLSKEEWKAKWVEPEQDTIDNGPAIYLRKEFTLDKKVKRARAYATAHGLYNLHLNGQKVGDMLFAPGWTAYEKRLQYQVYDITDLLNTGQNAVGAVLGDGWYKGTMGWVSQWGYYGKKVGLLCQLNIELEDGTTETIITDGSWESTHLGPILLNSIYDGEIYDARKELIGWDRPGYEDSNWQKVRVADYGTEELVPMETVPVKRIKELTPIKIWTTPEGTLVADMGQNMVGWVKLKVKGPRGTTITLRHAERLDKDGEFYTANLRDADAMINYTLKGGEEEVYEPHFTFMGFRYVSIEGFPGELKPENLTGVVIHSDMEPLGTFECSDPLVNQLQHNIEWGQRGNFLEVPTDCPQRDERLGWTGDAQAFIRTAAYNMDVAAFFTKWLKDLEADQNEEGAIPRVIPNVLGKDNIGPCAGWADVATIAPWTIYQVYGDQRILAEQYPSMKKYVDFIRKDAGDNYLWEGGSEYGDWLFFKPELTHHTTPDGHTDKNLIATAFYAYSTQLLIKAAKVLGKKEDVEEYSVVLEKVKQAFNDNYVTPAGRVVSHSQTAYVLALMFDLLPKDLRQNAVNYLVENIRSRDNHLSTGFLGTPYICHVLSENDQTEVAYNLLLQKSFPSWLYPVTMGATTIWERWDGFKPDSTFQNTGMNSFNHYAYGAIGDWMYRVVAGIEIGAPGYKHILIQPQPDSRLDYATATYESRYGQIASGWSIDDGKLKIDVTIPPNTTATITLPDATINKVKESGQALAQNYRTAKEGNGNVVLEVGSGKYLFEYHSDLAIKPIEEAPKN